MRPEEALRTGISAGSTSAGTAVAARACLGYQPTGPGVMRSGVTHRVAHAWIAAVCKGGVHVISVYLRHSEGLSQENITILDAVACFIDTLRGPWLITGDFNMEPDVLRSSGWTQVIGGQLHVAEQGTCNDRKYDYFVVDQALSPYVRSVRRLDYHACNPHFPVRLVLSGDARRMAVRKLVRPPHIPATIPFGPQVHPDRLPRLPSTTEIRTDLDAAAVKCRARVQAELLALVGDCAAASVKARYVWACPLGNPGDPEPGADAYTVIWRTFQRRGELAAITAARSDAGAADLLRRLATRTHATARWCAAKTLRSQ